MNFQKFIYDFLKFNDFYRRENDIFADFEAQKSGEMGVKYEQNLRSSIKQPLGLRAEALKSDAVGVSYNFDGISCQKEDYRRGETSPQNRRSRIKLPLGQRSSTKLLLR